MDWPISWQKVKDNVGRDETLDTLIDLSSVKASVGKSFTIDDQNAEVIRACYDAKKNITVKIKYVGYRDIDTTATMMIGMNWVDGYDAMSGTHEVEYFGHADQKEFRIWKNGTSWKCAIGKERYT